MNRVHELRKSIDAAFPGWEDDLVAERYRSIEKLCAEVLRRPDQEKETLTTKLDRFFLHPVLGFLNLLLVLGLLFFLIFKVAEGPMGWIEAAFAALGSWVTGVMPPGDLRDLIVDGAINGVSGVVIFLPQILILFFFIGIMEDTGYMSRLAFIMDWLMSKVGLNGKSFLPLLSAHACAVPAIMATRTIDSPKDRLITILVAPLASCSARLPVYLRILGEQGEEGVESISSEGLAELAGVNAAKVRKDLSYLGSYGTRGVGYEVAYLVYQICRELGLTHDWPVVIVGAGNLGQALAGYGGFGERGFPVAGIVDIDDSKVGTVLGGTRVRAVHLPGHTAGHCVLLVEPQGIAFIGDFDLSSFGPYYGDASSSLEQFEATLALLTELPLASLHVFSYSEREGTAAIELPDPVPPFDPLSVRDLKAAFFLVMDERAKLDKLRKQVAGTVGTGQLDLHAARDEIGRRLARLRDANGG